MIAKDRNPSEHDDTDRMAATGARSEAQMAFYLKRAFADAASVQVFHDLRLAYEDGSDAAQIDHLVLHSGGIVIIESKSVTSEVRINENLEFSRLWDGRWQGFRSPVQQSKLQVDFLRKVLAANVGSLRDKAIFGLIQKGFGHFPFDILVAISDSGIIHRKAEIPEVLKADHVADRLKEIMGRRCIGFAAFAMKSKNDNDPWVNLSPSEMKRIADFMNASHRPQAQKPRAAPVIQPAIVTATSIPAQKPEPVKVPLATTTTKPACKHCNSGKVNVAYGRNYYLKCDACGKNTPIDYACTKCGKDSRIRREKLIHYRECQCGHTEVYLVNEVS